MEDTRCFVSKLRLTLDPFKVPAFSLQTAAPLALAIVSNDNNPLAKIITHKALRNKKIYLACSLASQSKALGGSLNSTCQTDLILMEFFSITILPFLDSTISIFYITTDGSF